MNGIVIDNTFYEVKQTDNANCLDCDLMQYCQEQRENFCFIFTEDEDIIFVETNINLKSV